MKKSKLKNVNGEGVIVSTNLQAVFIFLVVLAQAMSSLGYFWTVAGNDTGVSTRAWVEQLFYLLFPVILVGTAYIYTAKYKSLLNRLFVAIVKAVAAFSFFAVLSTVNNQVMIIMAENGNVPPPEFFTSLWATVLLMAFTFALFVGVLHFWMYDKKGR